MKKPTFGSMFAGIGGFDAGLEAAGWECRWQVEIEEYPQRVLRHRWPNVRLYHDVTKVLRGEAEDVAGADRAELAERAGPPEPAVGPRRRARRKVAARGGGPIPGVLLGGELEPVDLICGGFPCQDLSVAGRRAGLGGGRSGLFWQVMRLAVGLRPEWLLLENVPGLFTSADGRDFGVVLGAMVERGYSPQWRVVDSRYFGVAQRRRRVFIIGHLGADGAPPVLFEPAGGEGNSATRRKAWARFAPGAGSRAPGARLPGSGLDAAGGREGGAGGGAPGGRPRVAQTLAAEQFRASIDGGMETILDAAQELAAVQALDTLNQQVGAVSPTLRDPNGTFGDGLPAVAYDVAPTLMSSMAEGREQYDTFAVMPGQREQSPTVSSKWSKGSGGPAGAEDMNLVAGTLNSGGHDGGFRTEPGEHIVAAPLADALTTRAEALERSGDEGGRLVIAEPLTAGSDVAGRRRREDDYNAVVAAPLKARADEREGRQGGGAPGCGAEDAESLIVIDEQNAGAVAEVGSLTTGQQTNRGFAVATFQQSSMAGKGTVGFEADATVSKPVKTQPDGQGIIVSPALVASMAVGGSGLTQDEYLRAMGKVADQRDEPLDLLAFQCHGTNVGPMGTLRGGNGNETGGVPMVAHTLKADGHDASEDGTGRGVPVVVDMGGGKGQANVTKDRTPTLNTSAAGHAAGIPSETGPEMAVRRLMPVECERLQGFADGWTCVCAAEGGPACECPDSPRYKALGNAVTRNVAEWIGIRTREWHEQLRAWENEVAGL